MNISHPNMTPEWFDAAIHRAHTAGLRMLPTRRHGVRFITSGSSNTVYQVTRTSCQCEGHRQAGRCYHRAFAIFLTDVMHQAPEQITRRQPKETA